MKFVKNADVNGTCLQGEVSTTYDNLVKFFGKPDHTESGDGKVTCEWCLQFEDGTVATIYDWKVGYTPKFLYDWHIGGTSQRAVHLVSEVMGGVARQW